MHFHSTASDGDTTQTQLLELAKQRGITHAFLTDHDVVGKDFAWKARQQWIFSAESVEISAYNKEENFSLHIAMYAQTITGKILDLLENTRVQKEWLITKQIARFKEEWCIIETQDFYDFYQSLGRSRNTLAKFDIARYLLENEINREIIEKLSGIKNISVVDFYTMFLKRWGAKFEEFWVRVPEYEATLEDCFEAKQHNNAVLSLVHPNFTFKKWKEEFLQKLPYYIKVAWINAIEINSKATKDWVEMILQAKEKYGLYLTFGSDCHHIGNPDEKHEDFWVMNPYILERYGEEFIQKEFEKYENLLQPEK